MRPTNTALQGILWGFFGCMTLAFGPTAVYAKSPTTRPIRPKTTTTKPARANQVTSKKVGNFDPGAQLRKRVVEVRLKNGMLFLLVRRPFSPTFTAYIRVKAGGVDDRVGYTGLAHIFEHMAFKGTTVVGTRNWKKEKAVLQKLYRVGEALNRARIAQKGKKTPAILWLETKQKQLQKIHQRLAHQNAFNRIYQTNGGVGLNATTSKDLTSYFVSLPSNRLELWALMEASRLAAPVFREFYKERAVVAEERRMTMLKGSSRLYEQFLATAFSAHPYRLPISGWMSDITTIPLSKLKEFYKKYYTPQNMVGTLVGDIDIAKTKKLLQRTFGLLPPGPKPSPIRTREPKQQGERRIKVRFNARSHIYIGFHKPTAPHPDDDVFDVLEGLLVDGPSSRLYRALVKTRIARKKTLEATSVPGSRYPNLFAISAQPIAPHKTSDIEKVFYKELNRLKKELVKPKELQKVRNKIAMRFLRSLRSNKGLASQLSYFQAITGNWRYATYHSQRLKKVTPKAIMQAAKKYFRSENRTVALLVPKKPKVLLQDNLLSDNLEPLAPTPKKKKVISKKLTKADKVYLTKLLQKSPPSPIINMLPKGLQKHPGSLKYQSIVFTPPKPSIHKLPNGITLYLLEDHELPIIDVHGLLRTGRIYDPMGKIGISELAGSVMRSGGYGTISGNKLDKILATRAARLVHRMENEAAYSFLSVHKKDLTWGLQHLFGMLRKPRFPKKKLKQKRANMMERYLRRNDSPFRAAVHVMRRSIYGKNTRWSKYPTPKTIMSITQKDLKAFHKKYYHPNQLSLAIVGSFHTVTLLKQIKTLTVHWKPQKVSLPKLKPLPKTSRPQVILIRKAIPQSLIFMGHLGPRRHQAQLLAGKMMNHILGGGGFSSRLTTEIRTNRGLAYFAGSQLYEAKDRGLFVAFTGSKTKTTGIALKTMLQIVKDMHKKPSISAQELQLTRASFLNRFIFKFRSSAQIVYRRMEYDYLGYPQNYLEKYKKRLLTIKRVDLEKAAKRFIFPKQFVIVVVGWDPGFDLPLKTFGKVKSIQLEK